MTAVEKDLYPSRKNAQEKILTRHDPVLYATRMRRSPDDAERTKKYEREGFFVIDNVFNVDERDCFIREAARLQVDSEILERDEVIVEPDGQIVRSIFSVDKFSRVFDKLIHDARLVNIARYLLKDEVYVHQSRLNYKPAFEGKDFYWHSDFETWHVEDGMPRMRALSMSIALTENRVTNGSVMLIPGSHQRYVSCVGETPEEHYKQSLRKQEYGVPSQRSLAQLIEGNDIAMATGCAGSVLVFDCNTMHGSAGNITPYARTNLFIVYNAMSNQLTKPYSGQKPRPDFIARRNDVKAVVPVAYSTDDYHS